MALFGFSDISFNKGTSQRKGPLAPLVQNEFQTTLLRYPLDIGNADKGHYMVFYIREQTNTSFPRGSFFEKGFTIDGTQAAEKQLLSGLPSGVGPGGSSIGQELLGKVNGALGQLNAKTNGALKGVTSVLGKAATSAASAIDNVFGKAGINVSGNSVATSTHIDTSIKAITAGKSALDKFKEEGVAAGAGSIAKSIGLEAASAITGLVGDKTGGALFTAATGVVKNPMLEMIYSAPSFRQFTFDFTFYPRDEREALEVQRIIERFRFHQAPELAKGAKGFLIAPSEFDIKFYYAGSQNPNIPAIADSCVLTQIDVNYAPNGFVAYEVPNENKPSLGRTGMPVAIQMQLQFKETTFLTKGDFKDDKDPMIPGERRGK